VTGPPPTPPPKWKTAIVTLVAVFPPVLFFNVTVIPYLGGVSVVVRTLTLCIGVTAAVTWVMMPLIMPLVKNWVNAPKPEAPAAEPASWGSSRSRRRRGRGDDYDDEDTRPAWLLEPAPAEPDADTGPWYEPRPAPRWDDEPTYPQGNRRAPWYGRQQPWYGRPDEDDYPTEVFRRDDYREVDSDEEPARDRGRGTGRYRR
jgi:hypothetical protein